MNNSGEEVKKVKPKPEASAIIVGGIAIGNSKEANKSKKSLAKSTETKKLPEKPNQRPKKSDPTSKPASSKPATSKQSASKQAASSADKSNKHIKRSVNRAPVRKNMSAVSRQNSGINGDILDSKKEPQKPQMPIICVDIPVAKPGAKMNESAVTFNVSSLCEDKYGFNAVTGNNRLALDLGDDLDDEMDADDDEPPVRPSNSNADEAFDDAEDVVKQLHLDFKPGMTDDEKEEMVLKELHRRRMEDNKRIGKYDIEDPFIDDEELQFEEQTKNSRNPFCVYYGDWVEPEHTRKHGGFSKRRSARVHSPPGRSNSKRRRSEPQNSTHGSSNRHPATKKAIPTVVVADSKPVIASSNTSNKIIIGAIPRNV